jgi:hypothetical protein
MKAAVAFPDRIKRIVGIGHRWPRYGRCSARPRDAKAAIDVPLALPLIGLGLVIVIVPSLAPGITPPTR